MLYKKHSNLVLLSILGHNYSGTNFTNQNAIESAKASFHMKTRQDNEAFRGKECIIKPRKTRSQHSNILNEESIDPDIGILTVSVPSLYCGPSEVCQVDPTSSSGGRCISNKIARSTFLRAMQIDRSLQASDNALVSIE